MNAVWLFYFCVYAVKSVESSHFMGGAIQWRPIKPAAFDGRVQIRHRVFWRSNQCNQTTIGNANVQGAALRCQSGCVGNIVQGVANCTDISVADYWNAGEMAYTFIFRTFRTHPFFEAVFANDAWITLFNGQAPWELRVRGNLIYREDTGLINSSPVVNIPPLIRIQHGCSHTIKIPVADADGDHIRCRWAESSLNECGGVCRNIPADLNGRECEVQYVASNVTGDYTVALQVEDFMSPTDITPLSSVPVQFVVRVQDLNIYSNPLCTSQPEFISPTPLDGACIGVPFNATWNARIIARVSRATTITDFVTASPFGLKKSDVTQFGSAKSGEWQVNVTWTPVESQFGLNIFCYAALDNLGLQSTHRCITLLAGVEPPMIVPGSMSPRGKTFINQSLWSMSIQFDKQFTRPTRDTFIRIFNEPGEEVLSINVKTSSVVTYPSGTLDPVLKFNISGYQLRVDQTFYILLDPGVVVGVEFCHPESIPLTDRTLWTFSTIMDPEHTDHDPQYISLVITTGCSCTALGFIFGIICGVIMYCCLSALRNRKIKKEQNEPIAIYDEVIDHHHSQRRMPNPQMELNVAYKQNC